MYTTKRQFIFCLLIIALFSLVTITWFHGSDFIGVGDNAKSANLTRTLKTINSGWRSEENLGFKEYGMSLHFPFALFSLAEYLPGISPEIGARIRIYLSLFLPASLMFLFVDRFFKQHFHFLAKLAAALFYIFNPYAMLQPLGTVVTKFPVYVAMPIVSYFMMGIFQTNTIREKLKAAVYFALSTVFAAGAFINIAEAAPLFVVAGAFLFFELLTHDQKLKNILVVFFAGFSAFLVNFWWLYSSFYSQFLARNELVKIVTDFDAGGTFVFDALRLFGFWALPSYFKHVLYFPFGKLYYNFWVGTATYIIPLLVYFPITYILRSKSKKNAELNSALRFMLFLSFLGIFLVKGRTNIGGTWYQYLYTNFHFFRIFREPFSKFSLISVFTFSTLIGASMHLIFELIKNKMRLIPPIVLAVFVLIFALISLPMFSGQIVSDYTYGPIKQTHSIVPKYWKNLDTYTQQSELPGRTLTLPRNGYYSKSFIWPAGFSGQPYMFYLNGTAVYFKEVEPITEGDLIIKDFYSVFEDYTLHNDNSSFRKFANYSKILNIRYLLQMNDYDWLSNADYQNWSRQSLDAFYTALQKNGFIKTKQTFGNLSKDYLMTIPYIAGGPRVYRYPEDPDTEALLQAFTDNPGLELFTMADSVYMPKIYIPSEVIQYKDVDDLKNIIAAKDTINEFPVYVETALGLLDGKFGSKKADIFQEKISDSRYLVNLSGVSEDSAFLVFNETYDNEWRLASNCSLLCKNFVRADHFKVNGYANAWVFNKSDLAGDSVYIVHSAENRLMFGAIVSIGYMFILSISLIILWFKQGRYVKAV